MTFAPESWRIRVIGLYKHFQPFYGMLASMSTKGQADEDQEWGLYSGFEGYRTPTRDDFRETFESGIVVPDANVLLNLYRYTDGARDDLIAVLARVGSQLWAPHQVVKEFWRNRGTVLRDPRDTQSILQDMDTLGDRAASALRGWANRVSLPAETAEDLEAQLITGFESVTEEVERFDDQSAIESARDTDKDLVLSKLEGLLAGHVGPPFDKPAQEAAVAEGLRRVIAREPPGYMDKDKEDVGAAGDYLIWEQILTKAEETRSDVIFVTADVKEDWWRREGGESRGPRPELVEELRDRSGARLFMLRPAQLLELGRELLAVTIHDESVKDAARVDRLLSDRDGLLPDGGWTEEAIVELLDQLREEGAVQASILEYAASHGGFIPRMKVYEIAGYAKGRQLKGFTRPINRITGRLCDEEQINESAVDLLTAIYDPFSENPSLAVGFEIDSSVLPLVIAALDTDSPHGS
jgi:PIN like domain